jgi:ATP adenylyltransferase/5',5'''-P-1,P-4-tetraphosphate phosphorylase II
MIENSVQNLFSDQLATWELAANNYKALSQVKIKTVEVGEHTYKVQFNPARITSSAAKVDAQSIQARPCFLCATHRPAFQKSIPFNGQYEILVNPYPIFPRHLTIPAVEHTPQRIAGRFEDMLDLAQQLDDYVIFYNGPQCGASAPDHFHFQAGNKGFLPIENDRNFPNSIRIESDNKKAIIDSFRHTYNALKLHSEDAEPMMNLLTWYDSGQWIVCIFPRKKHRPACYFAEGDKNILISPASVDMGGVFITPLEKDFDKITSEDIQTIIEEI